MRAAIERGVKHVVAISTDKAVKPVNAMGMTKALQEKIFRSSQYEKNKTIFCSVRYGNVLGSRGSVIPLWDTKISKKQPLPVTHPDMTRFLLTLHDAIQLVFYALKNARGGEIFVRKAPTARIVDLAKAYAEIITKKKNYPIEFVGIRPGEKIHEEMITFSDSFNTYEIHNYYVIIPTKPKWSINDYIDNFKATKVKEGFSYDSGTNSHFLKVEELKQLIKKFIK